MNTIKENIIFQYEIKKSKFITLIYNVNGKDDVNSILNKIKCDYPNATHYVYAYIIDGIMYATDDKEPSGTAGKFYYGQRF